MPQQPQPTGVTLEEYMAVDEDAWAEVINGEIITQDMTAASYTHKVVIDNLYNILKAHAREHKLGYVYSDGLTFTLLMVGDTIRSARIPDVCFIRRQNFIADFDHDKPYPGKPDLAVEVVSPTERTGETQQKIQDYQSAVTEQVWVIYPNQKTLHQYITGSKTITVFTSGDTFAPETLFPGLAIPVGALFEIGTL